MSAVSSTFDYIIVGAEGQRRVCLSAHASRRGQGVAVATATQAMIQAAVDRRAMLHPEQCCDQCLKWVKSAVLTVGRSLPIFLDQRTFSGEVGMSQRCHCTKSLRSSPLRGSKSREAGSRSRGQRWRGGKVNTIRSCIVGVHRMIKNRGSSGRPAPGESHRPRRNAMTKLS
jgi:hypothetical protein